MPFQKEHPWRRRAAVLAVAGSLATTIMITGNGGVAQAAPVMPCDIYGSGGTPCVAAHSTTRALYGAYAGPLYQVKRLSDNALLNISPRTAGGVANAAAQDEFCVNTTCVITTIYDQSPRGNHLTQAPGGAFAGPEPGGWDRLATATAAPVTVGGQKAYGVMITPGTGYRDNTTNGVPLGDDPEGIYSVLDGTHYNNGCCFDYGNMEPSVTVTNLGAMETIYFGLGAGWGAGAGSGPWIMADLEMGIFSGRNRGTNTTNPPLSHRFLTAIVKGNSGNQWAIRGGNANSGSLLDIYEGPRLDGNYNPMRKEGAIGLGIGGDNSPWGAGTWYEGAMTAGYPSAATENAVQANIAAASYNAAAPPAQTRTIRNQHSNLCLDDYNWLTNDGAEVRQWPCNGLAVQQWDIRPAADGWSTIVNRHSGKCLDNFNFGTANGAEVRQWTCNGNHAQQWRIADAGSGFSWIMNRHFNHMCLDDYNWSTANGAEVRQWDCNTLPTQRWRIS